MDSDFQIYATPTSPGPSQLERHQDDLRPQAPVITPSIWKEPGQLQSGAAQENLRGGTWKFTYLHKPEGQTAGPQHLCICKMDVAACL